MPGVRALGLRRLADAPRWRRVEERRIGDDLLGVLEPAAPDVRRRHVHRHHHPYRQGRECARRRGGRELRRRQRPAARASMALGASVAHSGVCLTVVEKEPGRFTVQASRRDAGAHHARRLDRGHARQPGALAAPRRRAGRPSRLRPRRRRRRDRRRSSRRATAGGWRSRCRQALAPLVAVKGSIAVDGISLTVNEAEADRFAA